MTVTDIFRQILVSTDVERAVVRHLQDWIPVYLREMEIQQSLPSGSLPLPESWLTSEEVESEHGDRLPGIVVVSPGFTRPPAQEGDGTFRAFYNVGVAIIASAATRQDTRYMVRVYSAAIAAAMMQRQSAYGNNTTWVDHSFDDDQPFEDNQTINVGTNVFEVEVVGVLDRYAGPATNATPDPLHQPGSHWPVAESMHVEVEQL